MTRTDGLNGDGVKTLQITIHTQMDNIISTLRLFPLNSFYSRDTKKIFHARIHSIVEDGI